jgi:hypothetical protein
MVVSPSPDLLDVCDPVDVAVAAEVVARCQVARDARLLAGWAASQEPSLTERR